ncbi:uncharacterized protein V1513DRAFT_444240, partial [Lipomyces chichibuensis]|uniref:uncharacterized protein n=1 Tax=Lipomyces chichibuensis TaxID=1546026 RepID=UPI00334320A4
ADMSSPIENPAGHETIRALADTSPRPDAGSTNEQVCLLAKDTIDNAVSDAEADMSSPIENPAGHQTIRALVDTSPRPDAGLTSEQVCLLAKDTMDNGASDAEADMSSQIENPAGHETIRALVDTFPRPDAGSTNEQVSLVAKDTIDRDMELPVCAGESIDVTMHDFSQKSFENDEEHVVASEHTTSALDELPLVTYACVECIENDNDGGMDWIDTDISFGDILSQPYEPLSAHESTTAITTVSSETEDTHADICDDFFASDVSFTDILLNTAGRESQNDSIASEHSTDTSTTPIMGSGTTSPVSTTATTPIEPSDDTIVGGEKELFAEILFVNDEEWCLPVPDDDDGCCSNVSASSSVAAAAEIERKTDITAPVTEYSHVVIPAEYRTPYIIPVDAPVQDLESQDRVTSSIFASRTLSRVKSVLTSSFCSVPETSETISDLLCSFSPSIRRVLISDLNTKDIFHGACDHANPTGCANCSEKLDYLKRVRYGITASSCSDEDESVKVTRVRDNVLQGRRL